LNESMGKKQYFMQSHPSLGENMYTPSLGYVRVRVSVMFRVRVRVRVRVIGLGLGLGL
jgi:hypothetical protein